MVRAIDSYESTLLRKAKKSPANLAPTTVKPSQREWTRQRKRPAIRVFNSLRKRRKGTSSSTKKSPAKVLFLNSELWFGSEHDVALQPTDTIDVLVEGRDLSTETRRDSSSRRNILLHTVQGGTSVEQVWRCC